MRTLLLAFVMTTGCGSSNPLDPGAGDNAGTGTSTLVVNGAAIARPQIANAQSSTDFQTSFDVRITLNNAAVTTGTVTMTSASGEVPLVFNANGNNGGHWSADVAGYDEVYQLDVISGTDTVKAVRVDGPDIHTFATPTAGQVVDSTMPLALAWHRNDTADEAVLRVGDGGNNGLTITDAGSYSLAAGSLKSAKDKAEPNTLLLTRTNRVTPAGAAGGSELVVGVANTIDVVAQINPNAP